jgi:Uma2 family endonuclease
MVDAERVATLMPMSSSARRGAESLRHRRPVQPLLFPSREPENERVPESKRHLVLRTALYQVLSLELRGAHSVGSEQFIYWNARDPRRCCSPDAFVKLGVRDELFETWKTWERGVPELVVEIASRSDREPLTWQEKLERFHELGAREVVRFDADAPAGERVRVWDRIDDDLVERIVEGDRTPCVTLGLFWVVAPVDGVDPGLRLARDTGGHDVLASPLERLA